eukprot:747249-Hanusia_phi.AAC.2
MFSIEDKKPGAREGRGGKGEVGGKVREKRGGRGGRGGEGRSNSGGKMADDVAGLGVGTLDYEVQWVPVKEDDPFTKTLSAAVEYNGRDSLRPAASPAVGS